MITSQSHLRVQHDRVSDIARQTRRHALADVDPVERRAPAGRLRRRLGLLGRAAGRTPGPASA